MDEQRVNPETEKQRERMASELERRQDESRAAAQEHEPDRRQEESKAAAQEQQLIDDSRQQDDLDPRAKNSGHGKKTADKWNQ